MASKVLYPPVIDSYMPAFQAGDGTCIIKFSLSKYNTSSDQKCLHVSVVKQKNNVNAVKYEDDSGASENDYVRCRSTGIILNVKANKFNDEENLQQFNLNADDLRSGFEEGEVYKIQVRLAPLYNPNGTDGQSTQLNDHASEFSEQSTICVIKAIGRFDVKIDPLKYDSRKTVTLAEDIKKLQYTTLDLKGKIFISGQEGEVIFDKEILYLYNIKLYDDSNKLIEDSGNLYANEIQSINEFRYICKTEFKDGEQYHFTFKFITNNYFETTVDYDFEIELSQSGIINGIRIATADNDPYNSLQGETSITTEQDEGRLGLKFYSASKEDFTGNLCIRRSDAKSNFKIQDDIKIISVINKDVNTLPIYQDYTIESGVYYKYGVQIIKNDERSKLNILMNDDDKPIMRDFEYSFLLGDKMLKDSYGNEYPQQLKLKFNNNMNSYKIQIMESKLEPIGGMFPAITRNAALKYKIFPITGLISFQMDDNNLFSSRGRIYGNNDYYSEKIRYIKNSGDNCHNHSQDTNIDSPSQDVERKGPSQETDSKQTQDPYDYIYERDFRNEVLEFLYDGKPKLFKSPTEGNIIVRLTDINCTPNKTLDRMIYEFTSNGNEIAEATLENYLKYNFLIVGEAATVLEENIIRMGQVQKNFAIGENILNAIYNKYDSAGKNTAGKTYTLQEIYNIRITIDDKPLRYKESGGYQLGNKIMVGSSSIIVLDPQRIYNIDENITFTNINEFKEATNSGIYFIAPTDSEVSGINATVDFIFKLTRQNYVGKKISSHGNIKVMGQLFGTFESDTVS